MQLLTKQQALERKSEIISAIKAGKIFIYPTDTIYGMGCDATNEVVVQKIREIKERDQKPMSVIAPGRDWIIENLDIKDKDKLDLLPGAYTFILNKINPNVVAKNISFNNTLGVRIPNNWFTEILSEAGIPFVTTSVNISGHKNMESIEDVSKEFLDQVDYVIYEGPNYGKQSTRVDLTHV